MGRNTIAMLEYLTDSKEALLNITPLRSTVFFSALGGNMFVVVKASTALATYVALATTLATLFVLRARKDRLASYAFSLATSLASVVGAIVSANIVAFICDLGLKRSLSWFRQ